VSEAQPAAPPPLRANALASLLETPVQVAIGPLEFEVAVPKADFWLKALLDDPIDWDMILPGLLTEDEQLLLEESFLDGSVEMEDLTKALVDIVTEVSGLKWYTTVVLCTLQRDIWERTGARLILAGLRPQEMTFGAWTIAIFSSVMDNIDPKEAANFVTTITTPPPGYEEELDFEAEEKAFMSAMSMM
jgi:hypothetical protein